jgi:uncharacterized protein (DUF885 family)
MLQVEVSSQRRSARERAPRVASVLSLLLAFSVGAAENVGAAPAETSAASGQLNAFIDDFTVPEDTGRPTDMSAASFARELQETRSNLARLRAIDRKGLSVDEQIDWEFAQSILRGHEIEQAQMQAWKRDPRDYMRFNDVARTVAQPGSPQDKAKQLLPILELVPTQLANAQRNIEVYIPRFQELSVFMAEGAVSIFDKDVRAFAATTGAGSQDILAANDAAIKALATFIAYLKNDLPKKPHGEWAIGKQTYDAALKDQYLLDYDSDKLYAFATQEFERTVHDLEQVAQRIDPKKTWQQLAVEIKNEYSPADKMIEVHQQWVDKAKQHVLSKHLIPIPWKERVQVVPRAEYMRKYSYYGNFSRARRPDTEGVLVGQWQINPFEDQWDEKTRKDYLVEHDYGVIIVTAPHETYMGHHIQSLYQMHNPRKLRRSNGISIFSEGWGLYNEQLMRETGFFPNDRIVLRQLQLRLWRNARVVWDVGIHTGKMTYEQAISLLSDRVGFLRWAAQLEVDASAKEPLYRIGYFMGMIEILRMRAEFHKAMGDKFTLSDFHERLLKVGNMPPSLMRKGLMATISGAK